MNFPNSRGGGLTKVGKIPDNSGLFLRDAFPKYQHYLLNITILRSVQWHVEILLMRFSPSEYWPGHWADWSFSTATFSREPEQNNCNDEGETEMKFWITTCSFNFSSSVAFVSLFSVCSTWWRLSGLSSLLIFSSLVLISARNSLISWFLKWISSSKYCDGKMKSWSIQLNSHQTFIISYEFDSVPTLLVINFLDFLCNGKYLLNSDRNSKYFKPSWSVWLWLTWFLSPWPCSIWKIVKYCSTFTLN